MKKIILVTGANKGIGKAICKKILTDHLDTFVLLGSRDKDRGEAAMQSLVCEIGDDSGHSIASLQLDVADDESVRAAAAQVAEKYGTIHAIVNNAGIYPGLDFDAGIQTNVFGPYRVCNAFMPLLDKTVGRIVNVASGAAPMFVEKLPVDDKGFFSDTGVTWEAINEKINFARSMPESWIGSSPEWFPYGFSKACLNLYTIILAIQNPSIIACSCTPGFIDTDLTRGIGLKPSITPEDGAVSTLYGLFGDGVVSGAYYGSDSVRSPIDRYREPGDPPYEP